MLLAAVAPTVADHFAVNEHGFNKGKGRDNWPTSYQTTYSGVFKVVAPRFGAKYLLPHILPAILAGPVAPVAAIVIADTLAGLYDLGEKEAFWSIIGLISFSGTF